MSTDDPPHDGEAEALAGLGAAWLEALKGFEDAGLVLVWARPELPEEPAELYLTPADTTSVAPPQDR